MAARAQRVAAVTGIATGIVTRSATRIATSIATGVLMGAAPACGTTTAQTPAEPGSAPSASAHAAPESAAEVAADYDGPPKRILVELFSSQGCNSCPPADALIGELPALGFDRDAVVPLTFHVTYWDDLGWKDPFANPLYDQRQIGYAQRATAAKSDDETTIRGPYTPQMVVDGRIHFSGAMQHVAERELSAARDAPTQIDLDVEAAMASARSVTVEASSRPMPGANLNTDEAKVGLFAALAQARVQTQVPRGENAGKALTEHWVVRDFAGPKLFRAAKPENHTAFSLTIPADVADASEVRVVVFAQALDTMHVLAVADTAVAGG